MPAKSSDLDAESHTSVVPARRTAISVPIGLRAIAASQVIGALLGIYVLVVEWRVDPDADFAGLFSITPASFFALVIFLAIQIWKANLRAIKALQWVLAAQIPWLNIRIWNIHYDFYLLLDCTVRLGNAAEPLELGVGTRFEAYLGATEDTAFCGLNVAAVVLFALYRKARLEFEGR